jgi:hypothetical protein
MEQHKTTTTNNLVVTNKKRGQNRLKKLVLFLFFLLVFFLILVYIIPGAILLSICSFITSVLLLFFPLVGRSCYMGAGVLPLVLGVLSIQDWYESECSRWRVLHWTSSLD